MIIAPDFVVIQYPKTGTHYLNGVTHTYNVLNCWKSVTIGLLYRKIDIFGAKIKVPLISKAVRRTNYWVCYLPMKIKSALLQSATAPFDINNHIPLHGNCNHIPPADADKEIISTLRNPYEHITSWYYDCHRGNQSEPHQIWATFSFREALAYNVNIDMPKLAHQRFGIPLNLKLGWLSYKFILMYFKEPQKIITMPQQELEDYFSSGCYRKDMYPVRFFRLENLDNQFYTYLKEKPYINRKTLDKVWSLRQRYLNHNKNKKKPDNYMTIWNEETKRYFEETEKIYIQAVNDLAPLQNSQNITHT